MKSTWSALKLLIVLIFPLGFFACLDGTGSNSTTTTVTNLMTIEEYLDSNNINATEDLSGLYYVIHEEGSGSSPNLSHTVTVNYTGKLTNGNQFDSGTNATFALNNLIEGWQIGFQLLKIGSKATLYIPPSLGYGANGVPGVIPPNAGLIFEVELIDFY